MDNSAGSLYEFSYKLLFFLTLDVATHTKWTMLSVQNF